MGFGSQLMVLAVALLVGSFPCCCCCMLGRARLGAYAANMLPAAGWGGRINAGPGPEGAGCSVAGIWAIGAGGTRLRAPPGLSWLAAGGFASVTAGLGPPTCNFSFSAARRAATSLDLDGEAGGAVLALGTGGGCTSSLAAAAGWGTHVVAVGAVLGSL